MTVKYIILIALTLVFAGTVTADGNCTCDECSCDDTAAEECSCNGTEEGCSGNCGNCEAEGSEEEFSCETCDCDEDTETAIEEVVEKPSHCGECDGGCQ